MLAVLALLAALSWPAVRGLLEKSHLQSAAKHLRAALVRARLDAMESSTVRQLHYQPGTGRYEISLVAALDAPEEAEFLTEDGALPPTKGLIVDTLPGDAVFEEPQTIDDLLATADLPEARGQGAWSAPVLFYPNGRTSSARFRLAGRRGYVIEVALRAVTGTVAIGQLEQVEPLP